MKLVTNPNIVEFFAFGEWHKFNQFTVLEDKQGFYHFKLLGQGKERARREAVIHKSRMDKFRFGEAKAVRCDPAGGIVGAELPPAGHRFLTSEEAKQILESLQSPSTEPLEQSCIGRFGQDGKLPVRDPQITVHPTAEQCLKALGLANKQASTGYVGKRFSHCGRVFVVEKVILNLDGELRISSTVRQGLPGHSLLDPRHFGGKYGPWWVEDGYVWVDPTKPLMYLTWKYFSWWARKAKDKRSKKGFQLALIRLFKNNFDNKLPAEGGRLEEYLPPKDAQFPEGWL